jgi:hypothetical protein
MGKEQLAEDYGDIHMEKFDLTKAHHLPFQYNGRNKVERAFLAGYKSAEKEIKDLKNKYKSWLKDLENVKLTKTINQEEVIKLKAKIELLNEIEKKLGI